MNQSKRYLDIVRDIRDMIRQEKIRPGDRIPSERELAETLQVGRSTIREALRSLELLGLIETRRGEGTFLADHRNHRLVEVLSTFILQDNQSQKDVRETRLMHELSAIQTICQSDSISQMGVWNSFRIRLLEEESEFQREDFVRELMVLSGNRLSLKIWFLLQQYSGSPYNGTVTEPEKEQLLNILAAIEQRQTDKAANEFKTWSDWLLKERMRNDS
ncbi:GntR family transcriptional regulator [Planococcus sp. N028]|uniref:GntR family transcriptional regulator n=1 Tax=Planococcus shixiaomingii TaxID=3058393 RepID=A0ABT8MXV1_9BACL|nr:MULTISPECIES: GntR family transcriptional regulator [unclassified Planococcus (in: firmicutes)]MDN7240259.1 GntR family transcriptional regulator [Planococcus sp. N028]WKA56159.1 GntR family transcriptional regulator [Planococcus sp. N022]